jgi:hypothetical protein
MESSLQELLIVLVLRFASSTPATVPTRANNGSYFAACDIVRAHGSFCARDRVGAYRDFRWQRIADQAVFVDTTFGCIHGGSMTAAALTLDRRARSHPDPIMTPVRAAAPELRPQQVAVAEMHL